MIIAHLKIEVFKYRGKENCSTLQPSVMKMYHYPRIIKECMISLELNVTIKGKLSIELKH